jgi:hypothetical protein
MLIHLMIVATTQHALAEDDCEAHWPVVEHEGAYYIEGVGCVVGDIGLYCNETFGGDCITWDQAVAIYEESTAAVKSTYLLDCAEGSDHAYRLNQSTSEWEAYLYFDASGSASAQHHLTYGNPSCCDGFETLSFYYGAHRHRRRRHLQDRPVRRWRWRRRLPHGLHPRLDAQEAPTMSSAPPQSPPRPPAGERAPQRGPRPRRPAGLGPHR